jgi:hypothetical protein
MQSLTQCVNNEYSLWHQFFMLSWILSTINSHRIISLACSVYNHNKSFNDKPNYAYSLVLILWAMEKFLQRKTSWKLHEKGLFSALLSVLCWSSYAFIHSLQQNNYDNDIYTYIKETNFKFYIHDCCVQLQYVAQGVMDHWNASYHILVLEFGMYHISSYTESYPVVLYPSSRWVFYHCNII